MPLSTLLLALAIIIAVPFTYDQGRNAGFLRGMNAAEHVWIGAANKALEGKSVAVEGEAFDMLRIPDASHERQRFQWSKAGGFSVRPQTVKARILAVAYRVLEYLGAGVAFGVILLLLGPAFRRIEKNGARLEDGSPALVLPTVRPQVAAIAGGTFCLFLFFFA